MSDRSIEREFESPQTDQCSFDEHNIESEMLRLLIYRLALARIALERNVPNFAQEQADKIRKQRLGY